MRFLVYFNYVQTLIIVSIKIHCASSSFASLIRLSVRLIHLTVIKMPQQKRGCEMGFSAHFYDVMTLIILSVKDCNLTKAL